MKKFILFLMLVAFLFFLVYLAGSFAFNSLNIADWPDDKREFYGSTGLYGGTAVSWMVMYLNPWWDKINK